MPTQIEKSRDISRISELRFLATAINQVYQDKAEYPISLEDPAISNYLFTQKSDPMTWTTINWCTFGYTYEVSESAQWIKNWSFRLSTCLENNSSIESYAATDGWIYDNKFEIFSQ